MKTILYQKKKQKQQIMSKFFQCIYQLKMVTFFHIVANCNVCSIQCLRIYKSNRPNVYYSKSPTSITKWIKDECSILKLSEKKLCIVKCVILLFVHRISREYKAVKPCSNVKTSSTILDMPFKWKKECILKTKSVHSKLISNKWKLHEWFYH